MYPERKEPGLRLARGPLQGLPHKNTIQNEPPLGGSLNPEEVIYSGRSPPRPRLLHPKTANFVSPEPVSGDEDKVWLRADGGQRHSMHIATLHNATGVQRQQDFGLVQAQQHDYAWAIVRARRLPSPDGTSNTT
jgi:hypothetical protein